MENSGAYALRATRANQRRWAVLISGRGSNLSALLDARDEVEIALVVSSSTAAIGLKRAERAGVRTQLTPFRIGRSGQPIIDWLKLDEILRESGITNLFLAGFMKVIPASFVDRWEGKILNLHPSLLPKYPGLESIERAWRAGDDIGVTVHEVTSEIDAGKIILKRVTLAQSRHLNATSNKEYALDSSLESVELRVHIDEQRAVKEAIRRWNKWPML